MTFRRAIGQPTPDQQARQDKCRAAGCCACRVEMCKQPLPTEIHHQTKTGRQLGQDHSVALCSWHHRAICIPGMSSSAMRAAYGPSLAKNPHDFYGAYGDNHEQLTFQNKLIGHDAMPVERASKTVPRKVA